LGGEQRKSKNIAAREAARVFRIEGKRSECCDNWVVGLDLSGGLGWPVVYLLCFFFILFPSKTAAYFSLSTLDAATS